LGQFRLGRDQGTGMDASGRSNRHGGTRWDRKGTGEERGKRVRRRGAWTGADSTSRSGRSSIRLPPEGCQSRFRVGGRSGEVVVSLRETTAPTRGASGLLSLTRGGVSLAGDLFEDVLGDVDGHVGGDGQGDGVAGPAVDFDQLAVEADAQLGVV